MQQPPAPENQSDPLHVRVKDAFGWFVALLVSNLANLPRTWRSATPREHIRLGVAALFVITGGVVASAYPVWGWLLFVALVAAAVDDLDDIALAVAERQKTLRLLQATPTGAPRVAEIQCSRGVAHRFIYGPMGWEEAGPAVHADI